MQVLRLAALTNCAALGEVTHHARRVVAVERSLKSVEGLLHALVAGAMRLMRSAGHRVDSTGTKMWLRCMMMPSAIVHFVPVVPSWISWRLAMMLESCSDSWWKSSKKANSGREAVMACAVSSSSSRRDSVSAVAFWRPGQKAILTCS